MKKPEVHHQVFVTTDYRMFRFHDDNRELDIAKRRDLLKSMKEQGYLPDCPISCIRGPSNALIVWDGQNRLAVAEVLKLPVYYQITKEKRDLAKTPPAKPWVARDFAMLHAKHGIKQYQTILDFSARYGVTVQAAASVFGNTMTYNNVQFAFESGTYQIKTADFAEEVGSLFAQLCAVNKSLGSTSLFQAMSMVCRVAQVCQKRLRHKITSHPQLATVCATKDGYLQMLEDIYNKSASDKIPVRFEALRTSRERSCIEKTARVS